MKTFLVRFTYSNGNGSAIVNSQRPSSLTSILLNQCGLNNIHIVDYQEIATLQYCETDNLIISVNTVTTLGKTAYDLAVLNGYTGSLDEWLDSMKGKDGDDGIGIQTVTLNPDNSFTFLMSNGNTITTDSIYIEGGGGSGGQDGEDGEGIANISATDYSGSGVANTVTVTTTKGNNYSFNVYNGAQGQPGSNGQPGNDGATPEIRNGYWYINDVSTGVKAEGSDGHDGNDGTTPVITASAEVSNTSGSPSVSVTKSDTATGSEFHFSFSGIKGESGSSSGGEANVIEEIYVNGTKIEPVSKAVSLTIPSVPIISTSISTDANDDTKTASPKAVKTYVDGAIPNTSNFIQKASQGTTGLLKPDGTVDNSTYLTTHQQVSWTATSGQAGYIDNKPTIPTIVFIDHTSS